MKKLKQLSTKELETKLTILSKKSGRTSLTEAIAIELMERNTFKTK